MSPTTENAPTIPGVRSYADIGEEIGISPKTARKCADRALEKLRTAIITNALLLGYDDPMDYFRSGDDRIAKVVRWEGDTAIIQVYRPIETPEA